MDRFKEKYRVGLHSAQVSLGFDEDELESYPLPNGWYCSCLLPRQALATCMEEHNKTLRLTGKNALYTIWIWSIRTNTATNIFFKKLVWARQECNRWCHKACILYTRRLKWLLKLTLHMRLKIKMNVQMSRRDCFEFSLPLLQVMFTLLSLPGTSSCPAELFFLQAYSP